MKRRIVPIRIDIENEIEDRVKYIQKDLIERSEEMVLSKFIDYILEHYPPKNIGDVKRNNLIFEGKKMRNSLLRIIIFYHPDK
jgi:hypothetical protein